MDTREERTQDRLKILLETMEEIRGISAGDPYTLYALVHQAAARLASVDAFYLCLYSEKDNTLHFSYNYDAGVYDDPVTVPLGQGPTSWVVRNRQPFVLGEENADTQRAGIAFGVRERQSLSAVHVPILSNGPDNEEQVLGVLSAQAYEASRYDVGFVMALQLLAEGAGTVLQRAREEAAHRRAAEAASTQSARQKRNAIAMADAFVQMLRTITKEAEGLRPLLPAANGALPAAVESLCRACYRSQTAANEFPLHLGDSDPPFADASLRYALDFLTEREQEILRLLVSGATNRGIAEQLHVTVDTVKFHCRNIYHKLGVTSRAGVVQLVQSFLSSPGKTTPPGS